MAPGPREQEQPEAFKQLAERLGQHCQTDDRISSTRAQLLGLRDGPLQSAEDYAAADILTGGRMIFGVGRGYHSREVETFGSPVIDNDLNRELFEEQIEVILKAFNQESFSYFYSKIPRKLHVTGWYSFWRLVNRR